MKRIVPFLCLALVAVACEEDGPTVPDNALQLGVDCDDPKFESHPRCGGGGGNGGGGDTGAYTAISLGAARVFSWAADLSEPATDGTLLVTGLTEQANGDRVATLWTVTASGDVTTALLPLDGRPVSSAPGINDDGSIVVGFDGSGLGGAGGQHIVEEMPLMWKSPSWDVERLSLQAPYDDGGFARDVNNSGTIAGVSYNYRYHTQATTWDASTGEVLTIYSSFDPDGASMASSINNQGYLVGFGTTVDANGPPYHAMLWKPDGGYCDLHVLSGWGDDSTSGATGISDVLNDGTVLVVGPGVWRVDPVACEVLSYWEAPDAGFNDVTSSWQAVGSTSSGRGHPAHYDLNTTTLTVVDDATGGALDLNLAGQIVGSINTKGSERAVLWIRNP